MRRPKPFVNGVNKKKWKHTAVAMIREKLR